MKLRIIIDVDHDIDPEITDPIEVAGDQLGDHGPMYEFDLIDADWVEET